MTKLSKKEIRKIVKEILCEGWIDSLKKFKQSKKSISYNEWLKTIGLYDNVDKWAEDFLDDDNRYVGKPELWSYGFPLMTGQFVPFGQEKSAMDEWNTAKEKKEWEHLMGRRWSSFSPRKNVGWLKEPPR